MFLEIVAANPVRPGKDLIAQRLELDDKSQSRLNGMVPDLQARLETTPEPLDKFFLLFDIFSRMEDSTAQERAWLLLALVESRAIDMAVFAATMGFGALIGHNLPMPEIQMPEIPMPQAAEALSAPVPSETAPQPLPQPQKSRALSVTAPPVTFLVEDDGTPVETKSITSKTDDWQEASRRDFVYKVLATEPDDWIEIVDELVKEKTPDRISEILTDTLISPDDKELPSRLFFGVVIPLGLASIWSASVGIYAPIAAMGLSMILLRFATSIYQHSALATARRLAPFPGLFSRRVLARLREPLYFYLYRNFPASLTQKLLPYIPKIAQLTNQDGQNALHTAALDVAEHVEYERHIVIDMFAQFFERGVSSHKKVSARYAEQLLAAGVNPLAKDKFGRTCIDYLFANGHVDAVRALFNDDIYADAIWRYRDVVGRNPLHLAVIHNLPSIIHLMIASAPHKAEFMEFLEANDNLGRKPADYISNKYPKMAPIGEITVTAFETAYTKATGKPVGWRTRS